MGKLLKYDERGDSVLLSLACASGIISFAVLAVFPYTHRFYVLTRAVTVSAMDALLIISGWIVQRRYQAEPLTAESDMSGE